MNTRDGNFHKITADEHGRDPKWKRVGSWFWIVIQWVWPQTTRIYLKSRGLFTRDGCFHQINIEPSTLRIVIPDLYAKENNNDNSETNTVVGWYCRSVMSIDRRNKTTQSVSFVTFPIPLCPKPSLRLYILFPLFEGGKDVGGTVYGRQLLWGNSGWFLGLHLSLDSFDTDWHLLL